MLTEKDLKIKYKIGAIPRGRFRRIAKALGMTAEDIVNFIRQHKWQHKVGRKARAE